MHPKCVLVLGQGILLVYDVTNLASYKSISDWLVEIEKVID